MARKVSTSVDEFLAAYPPQVRQRLEVVRSVIRAVAPGATETISYGSPTFDLDGRHLVHYAAHARHIGFYPTPSAIEAFKDELAPYKSGKGSVRFPHDVPLPTELIRRMVEFRVAELNAGRRG